MKRDGKTNAYIGKRLYVDEKTVRDWVKDWEEGSDLTNKLGRGRKRKFTEFEEAKLKELVEGDKELTLGEM